MLRLPPEWEGFQKLNVLANVFLTNPPAFAVGDKDAVRYFKGPYLRHNDVGRFHLLKDGSTVRRVFGRIVGKAPGESYGRIENECTH
jgi:hypothetical protein